MQTSPNSSWDPLKAELPLVSLDFPMVRHRLRVPNYNSSAIPKQTHLLLDNLCCLILRLSVYNHKSKQTCDRGI